MPVQACPCESGKAYQSCCEPFHLGEPAPTAEALMRSRYSAYVLQLEQYLLDTWHPSTRPATLDLDKEAKTKWLGLRIKQTAQLSETKATVEFITCYKVGGNRAERLHEVSQFTFDNKRWYYVSGDLY